MKRLINQMFYKNEGDPTGGGGEADPAIAPDGTITQPITATMSQEQIDQITQGITQGISQAIAPPADDPTEEYVDPSAFQSVEAFNGYIAQREATLEQRMEAKVQAQMAPLLIQQGTQLITQGMDDVQKACFNEELAQIPAHLRANAVTDPVTARMLKNAAIGAAYQKNGYVPHSNDPASRTTEPGLDARDMATVKHLMATNGIDEKTAKSWIKDVKEKLNR